MSYSKIEERKGHIKREYVLRGGLPDELNGYLIGT